MHKVLVELNQSKKIVEVANGGYKFCRGEASKWLNKGQVFLITKTDKSSHKYSCHLKKRVAKNYNNDNIALKKIR